jgi:hypothetical protein
VGHEDEDLEGVVEAYVVELSGGAQDDLEAAPVKTALEPGVRAPRDLHERVFP